MHTPQTSRNVLLILLCAAAFPTALSLLMMAPLLVDLAQAFQTSVAVAGQLAAATAITWGLIAPLAGPVADAYGRRRLLLTGLLLMACGNLSSVLAWNYDALLAWRLITGVGAALVPPNAIALIADVFPPEERGQALGWVVSASGLGAALGVPLVAGLLEVGGWRLPLAVMGMVTLGVWFLLWVWCPRSPRTPDQTLAFFSHYREVGSDGTVWSLLAANALEQMVLFGVFGYLAAHLMHTARMTAGDTVLPLALAGCGLIAGGLLGGRVVAHRRRSVWFAGACLGSGLLAALSFTVEVSPWATVALACGAAGLGRISSVVTPILVLERIGGSRTTASGLFAVSNQLGTFGGASLGGLMLALGGFSLVGVFCLGGAVIAAAVIRWTLRDSELRSVAARERLEWQVPGRRQRRVGRNDQLSRHGDGAQTRVCHVEHRHRPHGHHGHRGLGARASRASGRLWLSRDPRDDAQDQAHRARLLRRAPTVCVLQWLLNVRQTGPHGGAALSA
jgi:predicted MFS family arabinose efflux permease